MDKVLGNDLYLEVLESIWVPNLHLINLKDKRYKYIEDVLFEKYRKIYFKNSIIKFDYILDKELRIAIRKNYFDKNINTNIVKTIEYMLTKNLYSNYYINFLKEHSIILNYDINIYIPHIHRYQLYFNVNYVIPLLILFELYEYKINKYNFEIQVDSYYSFYKPFIILNPSGIYIYKNKNDLQIFKFILFVILYFNYLNSSKINIYLVEDKLNKETLINDLYSLNDINHILIDIKLNIKNYFTSVGSNIFDTNILEKYQQYIENCHFTNKKFILNN